MVSECKKESIQVLFTLFFIFVQYFLFCKYSQLETTNSNSISVGKVDITDKKRFFSREVQTATRKKDLGSKEFAVKI